MRQADLQDSAAIGNCVLGSGRAFDLHDDANRVARASAQYLLKGSIDVRRWPLLAERWMAAIGQRQAERQAEHGGH